MEITFEDVIYLILIVILIIMYFNKNVYEGLTTFNGRMSVDDQYFYDKLFDDVVYYPNEYKKKYATGEEIGLLKKTGMEKCKEECGGRCVEYGITSNAYCFPY